MSSVDLARVEAGQVSQPGGASNPAASTGCRINVVAKRALLALTIIAAAAVIASTVTLILLTSPVSLPILVVSAVALAILLIGQTYKFVLPHLPAPLQKVINHIRAYAVDFFAAFGLGVMMLRNMEKRNPTTRPDNCGQPILLVHGYLGDDSNFAYHATRLQEAFPNRPIYTVKFGHPFNKSITEDHLRMVKAKIAEIQRVTNRTEITLVGHSMGGVISSVFATRCAKSNEKDVTDRERHIVATVTDVITLGSPLKGTRLAVIGLAPGAHEMRIDHELMTSLHTEIGQTQQTRWFNIWSQADGVILPNESAVLEGPNVQSFALPNLGHAAYMFPDRVADQMITYLR